MHEANLVGRSELVLWGTGMSRREVQHVEDYADALVFLRERYSGHEHVDVGYG